MAEGDKTVREGGGHTVREGVATLREQEGRTVREEGGVTQREGATVPEGGATIREEAAASHEHAAAEQQVAGWLPPSLVAKYRIKQALDARGGEADLYVVEPRADGDATRRVAKVYRQGIEPKEDVLQRVRDADPDHVVQVEAYGQDAGRWWELMEYAEYGSLRDLINREGPKLPDDVVKDILRQLNDALAGLHKEELEHRDLKPGNVLVRRRSPLQLVITDFGITSLMSATVHFTTAAHTQRFAPPEANVRGKVAIEHTKWDYWSLGMMLVEMLTGEHPYDRVGPDVIGSRIATQNFKELVAGVEDPNWRKLCSGLLQREPPLRWDAEAVSKWLADPDDLELRVVEEAVSVPGEQPAREGTIHFDGTAYSTPADLGLALSKDWQKAKSFWMRRFTDVRTWLSDGLGLQALGDAVATIDDSDLALDSQVFAFIYHLAPEAPLRFRDQDLSVDRIVALGERAVLDADGNAVEALLELYRLRIPMLAGSLPNQEALADLSARWDDTVQNYQSLRQRLAANGVTVPEPELDDDQLAMLLAASMGDSPLAPRLRDLAWNACTKDAWRCDWFREHFGHPDEMPVAAMAMLPYVHAAAERRGRTGRARTRRGLIAGAIAGVLFGMFVVWADTSKDGGGVYDPPEFDDGGGGGVVVVISMVLFIRFAIAWYRGDDGTGWERVLFGTEDEESEDPVAFSWRSLLESEPAPAEGAGAEAEEGG